MFRIFFFSILTASLLSGSADFSPAASQTTQQQVQKKKKTATQTAPDANAGCITSLDRGRNSRC